MGVDDTQPLISHLIELRKRLINSILAILVIFLALVYFANDIYQLVSAPAYPADAGWRDDDRHGRSLSFLYADQADIYGLGHFVGAGHSLSGLGVCGAGLV